MDSVALEAITKSEVLMQIEAAHRYPRDIPKFLETAKTLCTMDKNTAASCIYQLKRWDSRERKEKILAGPSVRLAEMAASTFRNLHNAARVLDVREREVIVQAQAWDLEANNRQGIEVTRNIMTSPKQGKPTRFSDDMIRVTCMAAIAIARRNAIFTVIPRAFINNIYAAAEQKATGVADGTFTEDLRKMCGWFVNKHRVPIERICAYFQVSKWEEMTAEDLAVLIGMANAVKDAEKSVEDFFPSQTAGARVTSKATALDDLTAAHAKKSAPAPANDDADDALTPEKVHAALADADEDWEPIERLVTIKGWSPAEQRIAYDWAVTFVATPENEAPPEQPEFTLIGRQMGDD